MKTISERLDENVIGKLTYLPKLLGMNMFRNERIMAVNTGVSSDMFNAVCLTDVYDSDLQEICKMFGEQYFALVCGLGDNGEKCRDVLAKSGFQHNEVEVGMFIDIPTMDMQQNHRELKISPVTSVHTLSDFIAVYKEIVPADAEAIERFYTTAAPYILKSKSLLKLFVGYIAERPIATGALFLHADVAGIWDITVSPNFRRRGFATDMVDHLLLTANQVYKHKTAVLTASIAGEKVYRKMGFQKIKDFFICNVAQGE
ncbi:MAG: GNAT family N-acetyltransferase [Alphaproteobacteria bacterium]|nr:GNAT family N-acetyltransferase [Alphaproteobacteria bacterium]